MNQNMHIYNSKCFNTFKWIKIDFPKFKLRETNITPTPWGTEHGKNN